MTIPMGTEATQAQVLQWLSAWFSRRGEPTGSPAPDPAANYFEVGVIDSLGLMELIAAIESAFGLRLTEDQFQDPRFTTLRGLSELVLECRRGNTP